MSILLIILLIILSFDIFLIFKALKLSNQLISYVSNNYPALYEEFGRPIPGFIRPNPVKAHRLEKYILTKGLIAYKDNEKMINLADRLKKVNRLHYLAWLLLFLAWILYLAK